MYLQKLVKGNLAMNRKKIIAISAIIVCMGVAVLAIRDMAK